MIDLFAKTKLTTKDFPQGLKFEQAFIQCLKDGVHPGPVEINKRMGRIPALNRLNGRDNAYRLQLMYDFGIPYKRGSDKGKIPSRWYIDDRKPPGWRKLENETK